MLRLTFVRIWENDNGNLIFTKYCNPFFWSVGENDNGNLVAYELTVVGSILSDLQLFSILRRFDLHFSDSGGILVTVHFQENL